MYIVAVDFVIDAPVNISIDVIQSHVTCSSCDAEKNYLSVEMPLFVNNKESAPFNLNSADYSYVCSKTDFTLPPIIRECR